MTDHRELVERLKRAAEIIDEAELPDDIRAAAFQSVVAELRGGSLHQPPAADSEPAGQGAASVPSADDFFTSLAHKSGVREDRLRDVFYIDEGTPHINLRGAQLGDTKSARTRNIIVLMAGAYRLGLGRDVPSSTVRAEVSRFGALDRNFSTAVRELGQFVSYTGSKNSKVIDLKPPGEAEFARRVDAGEDED